MKTPQLQTGFSLIEVLVTLLVVAVGLLGLAKLQAAVLSNTQVARVRSLVALQAASLAAAMRANRAFWAAVPRSFSAVGERVADPSGALLTGVACHTQACTPAELAADDVQRWVGTLNASFPGYEAAVACTGTPVNCEIQVAWTEKTVAINRSTAAAPGPAVPQRFTLHVMP